MMPLKVFFISVSPGFNRVIQPLPDTGTVSTVFDLSDESKPLKRFGKSQSKYSPG
jgi:hypothetical protein